MGGALNIFDKKSQDNTYGGSADVTAEFMLTKLNELNIDQLWYKLKYIMSDTEFAQLKANRQLSQFVKDLTGTEPVIIKCLMHTISNCEGYLSRAFKNYLLVLCIAFTILFCLI